LRQIDVRGIHHGMSNDRLHHASSDRYHLLKQGSSLNQDTILRSQRQRLLKKPI
jgi:hypothetical protein